MLASSSASQRIKIRSSLLLAADIIFDLNGMQFTNAIATYGKVGLIPQALRALPLAHFTKSHSLDIKR